MSVLKTTSRWLGLVHSVVWIHSGNLCVPLLYTMSSKFLSFCVHIKFDNCWPKWYNNQKQYRKTVLFTSSLASQPSLQINVTLPYSSFISSIHTVACVAIKLDLRQHFTMLQIQRQGIFQVVTCGATNYSFQMPDSLCFR